MDEIEHRSIRVGTALCALALFVTACGSSAVANESASPAPLEASVFLPNEGGDLEGHTPRGFPGSGTGLFAGDELNANFPADDGVQIWLTFENPGGAASSKATLHSDALTIRGNPFETLGKLEVASVQYESFGPNVFDIEPLGPSVRCPIPTGNTFSCDVSEAIQTLVSEGSSRMQLRLRFEVASDPDGEQDLAMFFITDSNTNEPGIFTLELE